VATTILTGAIGMVGNRLETVDKDLVKRLKHATSEELRAAALNACRHAIDYVGFADQPVVEGLRSLERGIYGDPLTRSALDSLANSLDEVACEIEKSANGNDDLEASHATFSKAREARAVYFALDSDALFGAMEAIYEANAATDEEWIGLRRIVLASMGD
jgi:hypothetical protein